MLCKPGLVKSVCIFTLVTLKPRRSTLSKRPVEMDTKGKQMDFERDFKIIAKKLVSVPEGLDYALGSGNFGKAYLVNEKNGPWKNRSDYAKLNKAIIKMNL